jgi:hypothetical protein
MTMTRNAAPPLCIVASTSGKWKCTIATPMVICKSTANTSNPPRKRSGGPVARATTKSPVAINRLPATTAPSRCVKWMATRAGLASTPPS